MSFKSFEQSVSESRIDELQREINFLARRLWLVQTEVEMNMPDIDYAEELKELVGELQSQSFRIKSIWWDNKSF